MLPIIFTLFLFFLPTQSTINPLITTTNTTTTTTINTLDKDEITETICVQPKSNEKISFSCPDDMKLIIREALFTTYKTNNSHCKNVASHNYRTGSSNIKDCYEDFRPSIIARCMVARNCSFSQSEMLHQCSANGFIVIKYSCIKPHLLAHYCNSVLDRPYGYISSPTYPDYCADLEECNWIIAAIEGQTIELQVLDLQLTNPLMIKPKTFLDPAVFECQDKLTIDIDQKSENLCGDEIKNLKTFKSKGSTVKLSYFQHDFRATRGWLVRYQVNGCSKLKDPFKGHIVEQNETYAILNCCEGYIFKDTRESRKNLNCLGNQWDGRVSSCVKIAHIDSPDLSPEDSMNTSDHHEIDNNISTNLPSGHQLSKPKDDDRKALFSDFVLPISLMVILIVALVIFVVTIVKCRSRRSKAILLTYTHEANVPLTSPVNV